MAKKNAPASRRANNYQKLEPISLYDSDLNDIAEEMTSGGNITTMNIQYRHPIEGLHEEMLSKVRNPKTNVVFADGPAGTAKTYIAVLGALELLKSKRVKKIIYVRSLAESADKSIGSLPGDLDDKFQPWKLPLIEKLSEVLPREDVTHLLSSNIIECIPVNYVRGLTFRNTCVIIDEAQNMSYNEIQSVLTRFGNKSTYIIIRDQRQQDIRNSGFVSILNKFNDTKDEDNGIHQIRFTDKHVKRSKILKYIV